jgi:hypothetical protein
VAERRVPEHMTNRLLAVIGSIAFGIRQFIATLLSFVGLRLLAPFAVPVLIVALGAGAGVSARDTAAILASRPVVQQTTLSAVAAYDGEGGGSIWFEFDVLLAETSLSTPADRGTFFYLARDPADRSTGLLVRSRLDDDSIRQRVLAGRIVEDPAAVSVASDELGPLPDGYDVDDARYIEELEAGGDAPSAFVPSQLGAEPDGAEVLLAGRILAPATTAACAVASGCDGDDAAWFYYLADVEEDAAIVLRSPHPPEAVPVRLQGLYLRDSYDLAPVLESDWYAGLDADVPTERAFSAGSRPPITVSASWVPTIIFGALGLILLASQLVGYPVFAARARPEPARRLASGTAVDVEITGRLARENGAISLDRSPGSVERLSIGELALRMWRYGLLPRDLSRREAEERFLREAGGETDRLIVHERDQSALIAIDRDPTAVQVEVGRLYRLASNAPAVRVRQGASSAYLTARSIEDRDVVGSEIRGEAEGRGAAS